MSLQGRIRAAARRGDRTRPAAADRWRGYLTVVEPAVASVPRVHLFGRVPIIGDPALEPLPLAVWIESGDNQRTARTLEALANCTRRPVMILGGLLTEVPGSTRAEHVLLLRAGDVLAPLALERLGQAAALAPDAAVITCDEDRLDRLGRRHTPTFRPAPSPDRWLAYDDSGSSLVVGRERAAAKIGELSGGGAWRHELALALALEGDPSTAAAHVPMLLCHAGEHPGLPLLAPTTTERVLNRFESGAHVELAGHVRRVRRFHVAEPSVEVIVCFRDRAELLARCVVSLFARTEYERLTLTLVDNGSREPGTLELLTSLGRDARVRVVRDDGPFNFAALNNAAARRSTADVLLFLNNDIEIESPDWLQALLEEALRPEVGAVAPMLLYPDGTVQHAGAAIGLHGYAGHPFAGLAPEAATPFGRADGGTRNWLAVTAACMMVERAKFDAVGGFDETFVVAGNDVDLCLRLTAAGYRSLCVPKAVLVHDESRSRGAHIDPGDFVRSEQSYGEFLTMGDPFYNPNLTLSATDCAVRVPREGP